MFKVEGEDVGEIEENERVKRKVKKPKEGNYINC